MNYITEKELCERLQITRQTAISLRNSGMPHIKIERAVRYNFEDVVSWLKQRQEAK